MSNERRLLPTFIPVIVLLVGVGSLCTRAENIDPDDDGSQYAYAENIGWLNAEPNGDGANGVQVDDFGLTGWMWGENAGWISLSCENTSSCGTTDYRVNNDGAGNLSGFAWSENGGWVNFAPSTSSASISPITGEFSGYAWMENLGWINLSCANTASCGTVDYGIKTDWCQAIVAAPSGTPDVSATPSGSDVELSYPALAGAGWYEIVRGDLSTLSSSSGNFTSATDACVTDNDTTTTVTVSGTPIPSPADGYWYLVRGVNCKGKGTYDSGGTAQSGLRDAEVAGSGNDCQ